MPRSTKTHAKLCFVIGPTLLVAWANGCSKGPPLRVGRGSPPAMNPGTQAVGGGPDVFASAGTDYGGQSGAGESKARPTRGRADPAQDAPGGDAGALNANGGGGVAGDDSYVPSSVGGGGEADTGSEPGVCSSAAECATGLTSWVCDPEARSCTAPECDFATSACAAGKICLLQPAREDVGACYATCAPSDGANPCGSQRECIPLTLDRSEGICLVRGTVIEGAACHAGDITTGCRADLVCVPEGGESVCRQVCDFFAARPDCPATQRCVLDGFCTPSAGASAGLGDPCGSASSEGDYCGDDGAAWRGFCFNLDGNSVCAKACRASESDCGSTTAECYPAFATALEVGLCFERANCGDGGTAYASCGACFDGATATDGCCAAEAADCGDPSACYALMTCVGNCSDDACLDDCASEFPNGVAPIVRLLTCVEGSDAQDFSGACGQVCATE